MRKKDGKIVIDWRDVNAKSGRWFHRWTYTLALYAILHPDEPEVLYLGKADGTSVRRRWNASDKRERVWLRVEEQRQVFEHGFIIGEFLVFDGMRLTRQLVADIESLLIYSIQQMGEHL